MTESVSNKFPENIIRKVLRSKRKVSKIVKEVLPSELLPSCIKHSFSRSDREFIQSILLKWYDKYQRKLPWRDIAKTERDPDKRGYAVWVSEIMLQQTQVATVIPYFNKWMQKWPTVNDLAKASLEEVNQVWAGLGYYSRAKRLQEGAQLVTHSLGGHVPQDTDGLKNGIPGIGKYTACAISSVAYQQAVGVVDGNVIRVLTRLRGIGSDVTKPTTQKHLWQLADEIVSKSRPGDFNQALMEYGAVVCTPKSPKCNDCPLSEICVSNAMVKKSNSQLKLNQSFNKNKNESCTLSDSGIVQDIENIADCQYCISRDLWKSNPVVTAFPIKPRKKESRVEHIAVVVIEKDNLLLVVQRPDTGLLAGLWEFPSIHLAGGKTDAKEITDCLKGLCISASVAKNRIYVGEVLHIFSHIRTTYVVEHLLLDEEIVISKSAQNAKWLNRDEVKNAAVSTAMKKVLNLVDSEKKLTKSKVAGKKRKNDSPNKRSKQASIKSFFTK